MMNEKKCLGCFTIEERLPSLNDVIEQNRRNKFKGAAMKRGIDDVIALYIYKSISKETIHAIDEPVEVYIDWYESNKKRDADNIHSSVKFILDALQKTGIIKNDNRKYVKQIHHQIHDSDKDAVIVMLCRAEE